MEKLSATSSEERSLQKQGYLFFNDLFPKTTGCVVFSADGEDNDPTKEESLTRFVINNQEIYFHQSQITEEGATDFLRFTDDYGLVFKVLFTEVGRDITAKHGNGTIETDLAMFNGDPVNAQYIKPDLRTRFDAAHRFILGKMQAFPVVVFPSFSLFPSDLLDRRHCLLERCSIQEDQLVASQGRDPRYFIVEDSECLSDKRLMVRAQVRHKPFGFGL